MLLHFHSLNLFYYTYTSLSWGLEAVSYRYSVCFIINTTHYTIYSSWPISMILLLLRLILLRFPILTLFVCSTTFSIHWHFIYIHIKSSLYLHYLSTSSLFFAKFFSLSLVFYFLKRSNTLTFHVLI